MKQVIRHHVLFVAVLVLFVTSACGSSESSNSGGVSITAGLDSNGQCKIKVTIGPAKWGEVLDVKVLTETGILLSATGSQESNRWRIDMLAQDERTVSFDCQLDPDRVSGSGEYVVRTSVFYADSGSLYDHANAKLMVVQKPDEGWRILKDRSGDAMFTRDYQAGQMGISCDINLDGTGQPPAGMMYIKLDSSSDNYAPELILETKGGIQFNNNGTQSALVQTIDPKQVRAKFGPIMAGGSRIIYVPFDMDRESLAGVYNVQVTLLENDVETVENAGVAMRVVEEDGVKYLERETNSSPAFMPPELVGGPEAGGNLITEPQSADDEPEASPVVTPATEVPPTATPEPYLGPDSAPEIESSSTAQPATALSPDATATIEEIPPDAQTAPGSPATPFPTETAEPINSPNTLLRVPPLQNSTVNWNLRINGYYGNRYDIWNRMVRPNSRMDWQEFKDWVVVYNPVLKEDDFEFYPEKYYWLPELNPQ